MCKTWWIITSRCPTSCPDLEAALHDAYKPYKLILMNHDPEKVNAFQIELERVFAGRAQVLRSGLITLVELLPIGVTKGTALNFILDYLDILPQETMCFRGQLQRSGYDPARRDRRGDGTRAGRRAPGRGLRHGHQR